MSIKQSEREERINKLGLLCREGINPYPARSKRSHLTREIITDFAKLAKSKSVVTLAGRIRSKREHGSLSFVHLEDGGGRMQIALSKKEIGQGEYRKFKKLIDVGDFIEVEGRAFLTNKGEKSIMAREFRLLAKAIRPLPEKWHGLKDEDERLRKRYLDFLFNQDTRNLVQKKAAFWQSIRMFMLDKGFIEVETPILEVTTGGADARGFITHHNALVMNLYLRISMGELWQKRLIVAGLEKTFEIGRQFRNEGMDAEHLQDYSQMEFYWAFADYNDGMGLVEELFKHVAKTVFGTLQFSIGKFKIDLGKKWETYDYRDTVKKLTGVDILNSNISEIENKLKELKIEYDKKGWNITRAIDNLWKYCRKQISGPGFLVGVPVAVSPLAKRSEKNPELAQRFQPIIAGSELGNGYSELNDPLEQAERFKEQQKLREAGDEEAQMFDADFVEALEYGMPPTCGFGMSERVFSFFMNKSARECQIFPLMKPRVGARQTVSDSNVSASIAQSSKPASYSDNELGISYKNAQKLINKYMTDSITRTHVIETEAIMRALAKHFGENEEEWGIIGLLHDIDWDLTKNDIKNHTIKAVEMLKLAGASEYLISTIVSHAYGNKECGEYPHKERTSRVEHSLAAAETLTGLVIAAALVQPDKKLASVKLSSLKKKFKQKAFAANCDRGLINEIEKTGLPVDDFLELGLTSLQEISDELGL